MRRLVTSVSRPGRLLPRRTCRQSGAVRGDVECAGNSHGVRALLPKTTVLLVLTTSLAPIAVAKLRLLAPTFAFVPMTVLLVPVALRSIRGTGHDGDAIVWNAISSLTVVAQPLLDQR